ncbi:MAG: sigma-70 family RNA polymerase sigma factor [Thermoguttaceae bacterium]|nr:sigma-70 family RNA polymerase sigma factor [Thermoguttaceae bacterium]
MPLSVESAGQGATAPRCFATGTGPGCSGRTPEVHECRHAAECTASAGPNGCRANESQAEPHARREADSPPLGHASCRADDACLLRRVQAYLRLPRHVQLSGSPLDRCWNEFYRRHAGSVRRILRTTAMSPADQADCAQEVWAELIALLAGSTRPAIDLPRHFRAWLWTFTRRKAARLLTSRSKLPIFLPAAVIDQIASRRDSNPYPAPRQQEDAQRVRRILALCRRHASETTYQAFCLRWIAGLDTRQIAENLELSSDQVRWRQKRIMRKLRKML